MVDADPRVLGPQARQFVETWGPRFKVGRRVTTAVSLVLLVTWLSGITSFRALLVVVAIELAIAAVYGGIAGRKIGEDNRSV